MNFFSNLFGNGKEQATVATVPPAPANESMHQPLPEIKKEDFIDESDPSSNSSQSSIVTIEYGTNLPIDAIYIFIRRDYEQDGYNDAMINSDSSYKNAKKIIILNELKLRIEQVKLAYNRKLREIEVHIDNVEQQGLINTGSLLKARKLTFEEHLDRITEMEDGLEKGDGKLLTMIDSYERGFLKGLAARSVKFFDIDNNSESEL